MGNIVIKGFITLLKTVFLLIAVFILIFFVLGPVLSNISLNIYRKEVLEQIKLPPQTEIDEVVSGCGNSTGTGNHTDLYVAVLMKTDLEEDEFVKYFPQAQSVDEKGAAYAAMNCLGISFSETEYSEKHYVIDFCKESPFSLIDLRGH